MTLLHTTLICLGTSASLLVLVKPGLTETRPDWTPAPPVAAAANQAKSASLGGPITPTQPDFFASSPTATTPQTSLETTASNEPFKLEPQPTSDKPPAPFVDDVPRPAGGIIKLKME